jgi:integrase
MKTLDATTLTDARKEREDHLSDLRSKRTPSPDKTTLGELFEQRQERRVKKTGKRIAEQTRAHDRQLFDTHLGDLASRPVQSLSAAEVARLISDLRDRRSERTASAVYRILASALRLAVKRGLLAKSPCDGLEDWERPTHERAKKIRRLDEGEVATLVAAGGSARWRAGLALAAYGGLRLGELLALRWEDIDFDARTISVRRSLLKDGTPKAGGKTEAATRTVVLFPQLELTLAAWKERSPFTSGSDYVLVTASREPIKSRQNARRALDSAKGRAKLPLDVDAERLSWHSLRHSAGSMWLNEWRIPLATAAKMIGHRDASFMLKCYVDEARDEAAWVADVLGGIPDHGLRDAA